MTMDPNDIFISWLERYDLANVHAAQMLGISFNTVALYRARTRPVPRFIVLAIAALADDLPADVSYATFKRGRLDELSERRKADALHNRISATRASHRSGNRKPHSMTKEPKPEGRTWREWMQEAD